MLVEQTIIHLGQYTTCSVTTGLDKRSAPIYSVNPLYILERPTISSHQRPFLPRLDNSNFFNLSSQEGCSIPPIISVVLLWTSSNTSMPFLCWGPQSWTWCSRWGLSREEYRGRITSPTLLATLL